MKIKSFTSNIRKDEKQKSDKNGKENGCYVMRGGEKVQSSSKHQQQLQFNPEQTFFILPSDCAFIRTLTLQHVC